MQPKPSAGFVSAEIVCVHPSEVEKYWPTVAPWLKRAMERGDLGRFDVIEADVKSQHAILWVAYANRELASAAVTQIDKTECSTVCTVQACGGSGLNNWIQLLEVIETYARNHGCDCVRFMGRKGWSRLLKHYRTDKVIMERQL